MLRSRAFTPAFRFLAGLSVLSLFAAFVVGVSSEYQEPLDRVIGPLSLGWKGGVGNHVAYTLFVGLFAVSAGLAGLLVAFRDADPEAEAEVVHTESVPLTRAPAGMNYLPAFAAVGVTVVLVGVATASTGFALAGVAFLVIIGFTWTLRTWAERATGDDAVNAELYHRIIDPLRVPLVAIVSVGVVTIGISRVLLAVSKTGSVIVFALIAIVIFGVTVLLALGAPIRPLRGHRTRGRRGPRGDRRGHHRCRLRGARVREARVRGDDRIGRREHRSRARPTRGDDPVIALAAAVSHDRPRVVTGVARSSAVGRHFIRFTIGSHQAEGTGPALTHIRGVVAGTALRGE